MRTLPTTIVGFQYAFRGFLKVNATDAPVRRKVRTPLLALQSPHASSVRPKSPTDHPAQGTVAIASHRRRSRRGLPAARVRARTTGSTARQDRIKSPALYDRRLPLKRQLLYRTNRKADIMADAAHEQGIPLLMTVVNGGEVWYIIARQTSDVDADRSISQLRDLGIEFVDADWNLAHGAGYLKSRNKMSLADAFAASLAKQRKAHLVTGDQEFKLIEQEINISWL